MQVDFVCFIVFDEHTPKLTQFQIDNGDGDFGVICSVD